MAEETKTTEPEAEFTPMLSTAGEKVGDILRKERVTRRFTIETISKDLKINAGYLKALEESDFASLPPEPYVRVYIKSLTKYLSLDTEKILGEFDKERGFIAEDKAANKISITVDKPEKSPTFIVAAVLIVIFGVFAFIANQKGWLVSPAAETTTIEEKADTTAAALDSATMAQMASEDSALAAMNAPPETTAVAPAAPPTPARGPQRITAPGKAAQ